MGQIKVKADANFVSDTTLAEVKAVAEAATGKPVTAANVVRDSNGKIVSVEVNLPDTVNNAGLENAKNKISENRGVADAATIPQSNDTFDEVPDENGDPIAAGDEWLPDPNGWTSDKPLPGFEGTNTEALMIDSHRNKITRAYPSDSFENGVSLASQGKFSAADIHGVISSSSQTLFRFKNVDSFTSVEAGMHFRISDSYNGVENAWGSGGLPAAVRSEFGINVGLGKVRLVIRNPSDYNKDVIDLRVGRNSHGFWADSHIIAKDTWHQLYIKASVLDTNYVFVKIILDGETLRNGEFITNTGDAVVWNQYGNYIAARNTTFFGDTHIVAEDVILTQSAFADNIIYNVLG